MASTDSPVRQAVGLVEVRQHIGPTWPETTRPHPWGTVATGCLTHVLPRRLADLADAVPATAMTLILDPQIRLNTIHLSRVPFCSQAYTGHSAAVQRARRCMGGHPSGAPILRPCKLAVSSSVATGQP